MDHVVRYSGWGAHCLSGATADRSGEGIWLRATPYSQNRFSLPALIKFRAISGLSECMRTPEQRHCICCQLIREVLEAALAEPRRHPQGKGRKHLSCDIGRAVFQDGKFQDGLREHRQLQTESNAEERASFCGTRLPQPESVRELRGPIWHASARAAADGNASLPRSATAPVMAISKSPKDTKRSKIPKDTQCEYSTIAFLLLLDLTTAGLSPSNAMKSGERGNNDERTTEGR